MGGVHGHQMLGLPVVFDAVDSVVEADGIHSCGIVMIELCDENGVFVW